MARASLISLSATSALVAQPPLAPRAAVRAPTVSMMADNRWPDEPIFDPSVPDPVYDETEFGYTGKSDYGFNEYAEKVNGRAAMMGFTVLYLQEAVSGKGVLTQYGMGYDAGAVVVRSGGLPLGFVLALPIALVLTIGLSYGGAKAWDVLTGEDSMSGLPPPLGDGSAMGKLQDLKMPKLPF